MDRGTYVSRAEAEATTLREALERYQREITPRKKGTEQENCRIKSLLEHELAHRTLAGVRSSDIAAYRDAATERGLAPSTVAKGLAPFSHLFETARKDWGTEVDNPLAWSRTGWRLS